MEAFGVRLMRAMGERGQLCVGVDPHPELLVAWGLSDDVAGLTRFCEITVEALADRVAVVKPQSAFFERFGSAGVSVLESTIRQFRNAGTLVLLDVKRGDIGSTVSAYASAYLDPASPLCADAITASPFLGVGALTPMFDTARSNGGGVFVLALTSNPEGAAVQRARNGRGRTVAQQVIDEISQLNVGAPELGNFGVVVGATIDPTGHDLSGLAGPVLMPGLGAQGGRPERLRQIVGEDTTAVLPAYSREVLRHGPSIVALRTAVDAVRSQCAAALVTSGA